MSFISATSAISSPNKYVYINNTQKQTTNGSESANASSNMLFKEEVCTVPFVVHKILGILIKHNKPLHTLEVEKALRSCGISGVNISTNKELYEALQNVKRIHFDTTTKRLAYKNPYESIKSPDLLLMYINNHATIKGLKVSDELLNANPAMINWINESLKDHKLRGVKLKASQSKDKKRKKCRYSGLPNQCTIYTSSKCEECVDNVRGIMLYPIGKDTFEHDRHRLDNDVKHLWDSVIIPPKDQLLKEYNVTETIVNYQLPNDRRRRGAKDDTGKGVKVKMRRIYNTHLFTPQELRKEIRN